ncbi:MAG: GNAT family N-acetyltransferase, partial [Halioglobus sp.]
GPANSMNNPSATDFKRTLAQTDSRGASFFVDFPGVVGFEIRKLDLDLDVETIHEWFNNPSGTYWGMQGSSVAEVRAQYEGLMRLDHHDVFIGLLSSTGKPAFLLERYRPTEDIFGTFFDVKDTDISRHMFIAPTDKPISNFTKYVFAASLEFAFHDPFVQRVIGEPDIRNTRVIALIQQLGYQFGKVIQLPDKTAIICYLTREGFNEVKLKPVPPKVAQPVPPLKLKYHVFIGKVRRKLIRMLRGGQANQ